MKATDLLVQCLETEGVEYVFGITGKETLDLMDSLSKSEKITFIPVRHEQGAAFMADVYGRLAKKPGVCLATLGPGATNLLTGIANANLDHSPVVALTGQAPLDKQHPESHQYVDIVQLFAPATKWSVQIKDSLSIAKIIRQAFRVAQFEKPGAVLIELPENLASQMVPAQALPVTSHPKSIPAPQTMVEAQLLLNNCQKPLVIAGNGVIRQEAVAELRTFVEKLQAPALHSFMAKGILPKNHPQNYFTFGFKKNDEALPLIEQSDLLIVIGFDTVETSPNDWNQKMRPVLHIDAVPAEISEHYPVNVELIGDIKETLKALNESHLLSKPWTPIGNLKEQIRSTNQIDGEPQGPSLTIENLLHIIETYATEKTIVISDVGAHKISIARTFQPKQAGRLILSNGFAAMGIAVPGAIGAKLACPDAPVIAITGDGGALMNIAELETAKRLNLPLTIIVLNDEKLKLEEQMMQEKFNQSFGTAFNNPDFVRLAESFGVKGVRAEQLHAFEQALKEALNQTNEITWIDVQ